MITTLAMIGPSAIPSANPAEPHTWPAALAFGDRLVARNSSALESLLLLHDRTLLSESVIFRVEGMIIRLARDLIASDELDRDLVDSVAVRLARDAEIRSHCHALALEWQLTSRLESTFGLDPVLAPGLREIIGDRDDGKASIAMAVLSAQSRFAQSQRRMELTLTELPAELFHLAVLAARDASEEYGIEDAKEREMAQRAAYVEASARLTLQTRFVKQLSQDATALLDVRLAGVGLWLTTLAIRTGQTREQVAFATVEPTISRLLLTLRAAGLAATEAEAQALLVQPDMELPLGLEKVGVREAAKWLAGGLGASEQ